MATEASYRNISFDSLYHTEMAVKPVYDSANRVKVGVSHTITIDGYLTTDPDASTEEYYRDLMTPGGELILTDHGYGANFHVNGDSEIRAMDWGPHPQSVSLKPLGGDGNIVRVKLVIVVVIPWCDSISHYDGMAELCYSITHEIDQNGMTTERTRGHMIRAMTRKQPNDRSVPATVDEFRERLSNQKPHVGFQRTQQTFEISEDRRRLDWTWVDVELPAPLPQKVTKITARHAIQPVKSWMAKMWTMTLSATITMARGVPRSEALKVFLLLLADRSRGYKFGDRVEGQPIKPEQLQIQFTTITIDHDIFGLETTFRANVRFLRPQRLDEILKATKMWQPIRISPEVDYALWRTSLEPYGTMGVRGGAGLKVGPDVLVDICDAASPERALKANPQPHKPAPPSPPPVVHSSAPRPQAPPRDESWLMFFNSFTWWEDQSLAVHKPLPAEAVRPGPQPLPGQIAGALRPFPDGGPTGSTDEPAGALRPFPEPVKSIDGGPSFFQGRSAQLKPDIVQKAAGATRYLMMEGYGTRVGRRVPVPKVVSVGGVNVQEMSRQVREEIVGESDGSGPLMLTLWRVVYLVPEAPTAPLPAPANPLLGVPPIGGGGGETGGDSLAGASPGFIGD